MLKQTATTVPVQERRVEEWRSKEVKESRSKGVEE